MKPVIVLISVFLLSCLGFFIARHDVNLFVSGRIAMAAMLIFTSIGHFVYGRGMALMLPAFIPYKKLIVYGTGILEIAAAIGLLVPEIYDAIGVLLIIFFGLILPVNIYSAQKHVDFEKGDYTGAGLGYLWFRIPLQLIFIVWVWYFAVIH